MSDSSSDAEERRINFYEPQVQKFAKGYGYYIDEKEAHCKYTFRLVKKLGDSKTQKGNSSGAKIKRFLLGDSNVILEAKGDECDERGDVLKKFYREMEKWHSTRRASKRRQALAKLQAK